MLTHITEGVFFTSPPPLPRGRHGLSREDIQAAQRMRAMIAATELLALDGQKGVGIREICARASVSQAAFYDCFVDKDDCIYAAYDRFITVVIERLAAVEHSLDWDAYVEHFIGSYLRALEDDVVVARAFQVEMDSFGRDARKRRRDALTGLASFLRDRHDEWAGSDVGAAPLDAYVGAVYAVRQLASDVLDDQTIPDLTALLPGLAASVSRMLERPSTPSES